MNRFLIHKQKIGFVLCGKFFFESTLNFFLSPFSACTHEPIRIKQETNFCHIQWMII